MAGNIEAEAEAEVDGADDAGAVAVDAVDNGGAVAVDDVDVDDVDVDGVVLLADVVAVSS